MAFIATPGMTISVLASMPTPSTTTPWYETKSFSENFALVRNTAAFKADAATGDVMIKQLRGLPVKTPSGVEIKRALSGKALVLYQAIDDELKLKGLRFHHVFFALVGETADGKPAPIVDPAIKEIQTFRADNLKPAGFAEKEVKDHPPAVLQAAKKALDDAQKKYDEENKKAPIPDYSPKPMPTASEIMAGTATSIGPEEPPSLVRARAEFEAAKARVDFLTTTGAGTTWSYGGDGQFNDGSKTTGKVDGVDVEVGKSVDMTVDMIAMYVENRLPKHAARLFDGAKKAGFSDDVAKEYVKMATLTFARYFAREGRPNAINTYDGFFSYGAGFQCMSGAGVQLLDAFATRAGVTDANNRSALQKAQLFLLRCGIAISPKLSAQVAGVRVLHFEGDVPYVLDNTVATEPPKPTPPKKPRRMATPVDSAKAYVDQLTYAYAMNAYDLEMKELKARDDDAGHYQALTYLRFNKTLIYAFILLGSVDSPPGIPKSPRPRQIVSALMEIGFKVFVDQTGGDLAQPWPFKLWYLVRAGSKTLGKKIPDGTAAFTFFHHLAWWGFGGFKNLFHAMTWAIARGYVVGVSAGADGISAALKEAKIETKDATPTAADPPAMSQYKGASEDQSVLLGDYPAHDLTPYEKLRLAAFQEELARSAAARKDQKSGLTSRKLFDREGERDASAISSVILEDSFDAVVGLVRGVFAYVELTHGLSQRADSQMWGIWCKHYANFLDDLKVERDIKLAPVAKIPLPKEVRYQDAKGLPVSSPVEFRGDGKFKRPAFLRDGKYYVKSALGPDVELPSGVPIGDDGQVVTRVVKDGKGGWSAEEKSSQKRMVEALGDQIPTFPFEPLEKAVRKMEDLLVDETPIAYDIKSFSPPNDTPMPGEDGTRGSKPTSLSTWSAALLKRNALAALTDQFIVARLSANAVDATRRGGSLNSDGIDYFSDVTEGDYVIASWRDADEIQVGDDAHFESSYRMISVK